MSSLGSQSKVSNLHLAHKRCLGTSVWPAAKYLERCTCSSGKDKDIGEDHPLLQEFLNAFKGQTEWVLRIQSRDGYNYCIPVRWLPQLSALRQRLFVDLALRTLHPHLSQKSHQDLCLLVHLLSTSSCFQLCFWTTKRARRLFKSLQQRTQRRSGPSFFCSGS